MDIALKCLLGKNLEHLVIIPLKTYFWQEPQVSILTFEDQC